MDLWGTNVANNEITRSCHNSNNIHRRRGRGVRVDINCRLSMKKNGDWNLICVKVKEGMELAMTRGFFLRLFYVDEWAIFREARNKKERTCLYLFIHFFEKVTLYWASYLHLSG